MSGAHINEIIGRVDVTSIATNHTADDVFATPAGKVLALFDFFMLVFGILGNSIVLYGSKKYQAINIDRISTTLIEHLATAEILILVLHNLPIFLSLIFKSWVLGPILCYLLAFLGTMPFVVEILILVSLACYRVLVIQQASRPQVRSSEWKGESLRFIAILVWATGCAYSAILMFGVRDNYAQYQPLRFRCAPANFSNPKYKVLNNVLILCVIILPMVIIVTTNLFILFKVTKFRISRDLASLEEPTCFRLVSFYFSRKRNPQKSPSSGNTVLTISLICFVFVASYTPLIVFIVLRSQRDYIPQWFQIFFTHCLSLNITLNPFIYALTNKRFRRFVAERLRVDSLELDHAL
ncbi:hypothetical protein ACHWQZ_G001843 [Mnemiopsis leidyi]